MGVSLEKAITNIKTATKEIFSVDSRVRSVGITRYDSTYGFRAIRNSSIVEPLKTSISSSTEINKFEDIPIVFTDSFSEIESLVIVAGQGPSSPSKTSLIPEVNRHRQLCCGLQIQNFDDDTRQGITRQGLIFVGTLGCFVRLPNGNIALLSNNHVVAGSNRGQKGKDKILQPGNSIYTHADKIAVLTDFVDIQISPPGASPSNGAICNDVDAGIAEIDRGINFTQSYLPFRKLPTPSGTDDARLGDIVFKVGRSTGLTYGEVIDISVTLGPISYAHGPCWFENSFTIEGTNGATFSEKGDSGSVIVRKDDGKIIGILYAGNGWQTYACPINAALKTLKCTLV